MSNETEKTAVDLMFEIAMSVIPMGFVDGRQSLKKTYEQAKEMEKEQMIEFGELVWKNLFRSDKIMGTTDMYNETYGGKK